MASSLKSPDESEILHSSDTFLAIVRTKSLHIVFWVSVDGINHIMSINDFPSLSPDEDVHFQDLFLVLLPDAPSEWEDETHTSFRITLDGFASWSSVSRIPFLPMSTDSFTMPHDVVHVPLNVDDSDGIPLADLVRKKNKRRLKFVSNPRSTSSLPTDIPTPSIVKVPQTRLKRRQIEAELLSSLAA